MNCKHKANKKFSKIILAKTKSEICKINKIRNIRFFGQPTTLSFNFFMFLPQKGI